MGRRGKRAVSASWQFSLKLLLGDQEYSVVFYLLGHPLPLSIVLFFFFLDTGKMVRPVITNNVLLGAFILFFINIFIY